jgi:hypothetical protein
MPHGAVPNEPLQSERLVERPPDHAGSPRPGVLEWRNPRNGFFVCRLHYSADPNKRSPDWKKKTSEGLSHRAWAREYELSWSSPEGEPVVPEFDSARHVRDVPVVRDAKLLRFWDFGAVSPVVLFCQLSPYGQLCVLRELCPFNTPLDQLLPIVKAISLDLVTRSDYFDAGDPEAHSVGSLGTIAGLLERAGIHIHTNRPGHDVSYAQLRDRFLKRVYIPRLGQEPAILIAPRCPNLIEALSGGFHLSALPPYKPVRAHPMTDLVDALRYGGDNLDAAGADHHQSLQKLASADRLW